ncbi:PREDICTED: LOW QUALITY PROTEIN: von Willebrand factor C and EGF domain-containing protein [Myotis davidii]|uniref:LOW QUALITY PROTEIN: von Willebrand factor C and EGF domain-containing protein n=1 Tax=Myotis davidii TaxID=225400 RepID=UPI00076799D2|nr:PREDICTED: LOW QUALITY PROTEIN: von Willebrand factor C and EGF domain-containing protein [Myotis davidii]
MCSLLSCRRRLGPHVCLSGFGSGCCPGWAPSMGSGHCTLPLCSFGCGRGICIAPNVCSCQDGEQGATCPEAHGPCGEYGCDLACNHGGCQEVARVCPVGFSMTETAVGIRCTDTDECLGSPCQQRCRNSIGSYSCSCRPGFHLHGNRHSCVDVNECRRPQERRVCLHPWTPGSGVRSIGHTLPAGDCRGLTAPIAACALAPPHSPPRVTVSQLQHFRAARWRGTHHVGETGPEAFGDCGGAESSPSVPPPSGRPCASVPAFPTAVLAPSAILQPPPNMLLLPAAAAGPFFPPGAPGPPAGGRTTCPPAHTSSLPAASPSVLARLPSTPMATPVPSVPLLGTFRPSTQPQEEGVTPSLPRSPTAPQPIPGPSACWHLGAMHESGSHWTEPGCSQCWCEDGQVTCEEATCEAACSHPIPSGDGGCCPSCTGCFHGGVIRAEGAVFSPPTENCTVCVCLAGNVSCVSPECPPGPCETSPEPDCCTCAPGRCYFHGRWYADGAAFSGDGDECTTCVCQDGEVECAFTPCPELDCPRQEWWLGPGQCCFTCREPAPRTGCSLDDNGAEFPVGQIWSPGDPCELCICQADGSVSCKRTDCVDSCPHPIRIPGQCCPDCSAGIPRGGVPGTPLRRTRPSRSQAPPHNFRAILTTSPGELSAKSRTRALHLGSERSALRPKPSSPPSVRKACDGQAAGAWRTESRLSGPALLGSVACSPVDCPITCSYPFHPDGQCCPVCGDCNFEGRKVGNGQVFTLDDEPCTQCTCQLGEVSCEKAPCLPACGDSATPPGDCCASCPDSPEDGRGLPPPADAALSPRRAPSRPPGASSLPPASPGAPATPEPSATASGAHTFTAGTTAAQMVRGGAGRTRSSHVREPASGRVWAPGVSGGGPRRQIHSVVLSKLFPPEKSSRIRHSADIHCVPGRGLQQLRDQSWRWQV